MTTFSEILRSKRGERAIGKAIDTGKRIRSGAIRASDEKNRRYDAAIATKDRRFRNAERRRDEIFDRKDKLMR